MKVFLTNQQANLIRFLPEFKALQLSYDAHTMLREKASSMVVPGGTAVTELSSYDFHFLFDYDIFPRHIMTFATEWHHQGRTMQEGDVIVQQASLPPFPISLKCVFAVRILQIFRQPHKVGFSYGTLNGHPEMGLSEFYFALRDGVTHATIHPYSYPGTLLARAVAPMFTLPYQQYCTHRALQRLRDAFLAVNRSHT